MFMYEEICTDFSVTCAIPEWISIQDRTGIHGTHWLTHAGNILSWTYLSIATASVKGQDQFNAGGSLDDINQKKFSIYTHRLICVC